MMQSLLVDREVMTQGAVEVAAARMVEYIFDQRVDDWQQPRAFACEKFTGGNRTHPGGPYELPQSLPALYVLVIRVQEFYIVWQSG